MQFPKDLLYTKDHEWVLIGADGVVTIGITDHAQEALGDIVYAELPPVGKQLKTHDTFGVVESIKAVSDLYCPVPGTVVETNSKAASEPSLINQSAQKDGWLIKVKISDQAAFTQAKTELMDSQKYSALVTTLK